VLFAITAYGTPCHTILTHLLLLEAVGQIRACQILSDVGRHVLGGNESDGLLLDLSVIGSLEVLSHSEESCLLQVERSRKRGRCS
jgi:hypothetical protein